MNVSERRVSLSGIQSAALNPFTSAAIRVGNALASNLVIGPTPLRAARRFSHACATVLPTGETTPRPVTTTLRFDMLWDGPQATPCGRDGPRDAYCLTWFLT